MSDAAVEVDLDPLDWGARLRRRRERAGLSQRQLARLLVERNPGWRLTQGEVSRWESGARRLSDDQKVALARALGTKVATLFPYPADVR